MYDFRKIEPEDVDSVGRILKKYGSAFSDHCFGGLYIWQDMYHTEVMKLDETLIIRGEYDGKRFYQAPVGPEFNRAVEWMIENEGSNLLLFSISSLAKENIESAFPGKFTFEYDRDNSDYVYDRGELESYQGKKFQQKRNHVNRFVRQYGIPQTVKLDNENIGMIYDAERCWLHENDTAEQGLIMERRAIGRCIDKFDELSFVGSALLLEGRVVAFGIGEKMSDDTVIEHFEKAERSLDGCYTVMTQEFAKNLPVEIRFINREEDMGLEGLRKAKLSLNPCRLDEKYDGKYIG